MKGHLLLYHVVDERHAVEGVIDFLFVGRAYRVDTHAQKHGLAVVGERVDVKLRVVMEHAYRAAFLVDINPSLAFIACVFNLTKEAVGVGAVFAQHPHEHLCSDLWRPFGDLFLCERAFLKQSVLHVGPECFPLLYGFCLFADCVFAWRVEEQLQVVPARKPLWQNVALLLSCH